MKRIYNYSTLFGLLDIDETDTPSKLMKKIAVVLFTIAFIVAIIAQFFSENDNSPMVALWGILSLVGIVLFTLVGIRTVGQQNDRQNFLSQLLYVLSKVFLYIFLPALLISLVLIIYAFVTGQW